MELRKLMTESSLIKKIKKAYKSDEFYKILGCGPFGWRVFSICESVDQGGGEIVRMDKMGIIILRSIL